MYAYRKAMPTSNKVLEDRWQKKLKAMHKKRLKKIRPAVDNKPPPKYLHLVQNLKKQQIDEERYSAIERENYLLLDKMSHIMSHPQTVDLRAPPPPIKSLNKEHRKRELMRITEENQQILRRIQHKEPYYSNQQWVEDSVRQEEYLRNICEYPPLIDRVEQMPSSEDFGGTSNGHADGSGHPQYVEDEEDVNQMGDALGAMAVQDDQQGGVEAQQSNGGEAAEGPDDEGGIAEGADEVGDDYGDDFEQ